MKWGFFLITILFLISCQTNLVKSRYLASPSNRHVVLDIDWTIVASEKEEYRLNDGVREYIEYLIEKDVKISFFSGGDRERNIKLLKEIKLKNGKSFFDVAYKIKSKEDLTTIPNAIENARFSERFKKDLTLIDLKLENVVLIEDNPQFYLDETQKKNLFWLGKTFNHYETYNEVKTARKKLTGKDLDYVPKSYEEWFVARKKFLLVKEHTAKAFELQEELGIEFVEAFRRIYEKMRYFEADMNAYWAHYLRETQADAVTNSTSCQKMFLVLVKN